MGAIYVIISIVCSVGICMFFEFKNRGNNSMEKVKRYADKRNEDLKLTFTELVKQLKNLNSELEAKRTQAGAAVTMLDDRLKNFIEQSKGLEGDIAAIQNIESKVNSFAKILHELNEMTVAVETNLDRIKNEQNVVKNLERRIEEQQKIVDDIGKKIPQVTKGFTEKNAEQLKTVAATLLKEYEAYGSNVKSQLEKYKNETDNLMAKIQTSVTQAFGDAAQKAESLEETAFHHLTERATERSDKYLTELKFQSDEIEKQIQQKVELLKNELLVKVTAEAEELMTKINESTADLNGRFNSETQEIKDKIVAETAELNRQSKEIQTRIENSSSDVEAQITSRLSQVENDVNGRIVNLEE